MWRTTAVVLTAVLLLHPALHAADEADAIVGEWVTAKGEARFKVFKEKGKYHGKIAWLKEPTYPPGDPDEGNPVRDRNNPDASKRDRLIVGLQLLSDFAYAGRKTWINGTIYNAADGRTYKAKLTLRSTDKLHVRGYIGISLLGGTTVWTRHQETSETGKNTTQHEEEPKGIM